MTIAYDGTDYSGWQIQPNGISVQEVMQKMMQIILRESVKITGSGRTDAGVHAAGQTAHFHFHTELQKQSFLNSMNGLLPEDIRVLSLEEVHNDFHARYSATGKIYHYHLWTDRFVIPFKRLYTYHCRYNLSLELLREAANYFIGTHDFKAFANSSTEGTASYDSIRTISRLDVIEQEGGLRLEFEGNGFLYKMVRNIVGTLIHASANKIPIEKIPHIFQSLDRKTAPAAVPPTGLFLMKVLY